MRIGLVTPLCGIADSNPGSVLITDGIRWLCSQAFPGCQFAPISMFNHSPKCWRLARTCDVVLVCGNPRYDLGAVPLRWEMKFWPHLVELARNGIPFVDAFVGGGLDYPASDPVGKMARRLMTPKTKAVLAQQSHGKVIARDRLAAEVLKLHGLPVYRLPCSTWWARDQHGIVEREKPTHNLIVIRRMPGNEWLLGRWRREAERLTRGNGLPTRVVAHSYRDWDWAKARGLETECLYDPPTLMRCFAGAELVMSARVHASIPCLSLGTKVCSLKTDSRTMTLEPFGVQSLPFLDFKSGSAAGHYRAATLPPDEAEVVRSFAEIVAPRRD